MHLLAGGETKGFVIQLKDVSFAYPDCKVA